MLDPDAIGKGDRLIYDGPDGAEEVEVTTATFRGPGPLGPGGKTPPPVWSCGILRPNGVNDVVLVEKLRRSE